MYCQTFTVSPSSRDLVDFFLNIIVDLDYSGILYYFPQGGSGVTCPPLCALVVLSFAFFCHGLPLFRVPVPASAVCAGMVEGLGWCGGI